MAIKCFCKQYTVTIYWVSGGCADLWWGRSMSTYRRTKLLLMSVTAKGYPLRLITSSLISIISALQNVTSEYGLLSGVGLCINWQICFSIWYSENRLWNYSVILFPCQWVVLMYNGTVIMIELFLVDTFSACIILKVEHSTVGPTHGDTTTNSTIWEVPLLSKEVKENKCVHFFVMRRLGEL